MAEKSKGSLWWLPLIALVAGGLAIGAMSESVEALQFGEADDARVKPRPPIGQSEVSPDEITAYNDDWRYRDGDEGRERVRAAIDRATRDLDPLARELTRERLRERLVPVEDHAISIELDGETIDFRVDDCPPIEDAPLDEWVEWSCDEDRLRVKHQLRREALVQMARESKREFQRRFLIVHGVLNMGMSYRDQELPRAVEYELNYTRQQPPQEAR